MAKKIVHIAFLLSLISSSLFAQSILGLQYPFGIPLQAGTGPSLSMGGVGTGVANDHFGMAENVANLGVMNRAIFSAVLSLDFLNINENNQSSNHANFSPRLLSFAFPIGFLGTTGFSVTQESNSDSKFRLSRDLRISGITQSSDLALIRNGNAITWKAGWGYNLNKLAYLGLSYERIYFNDETIIIKQTEGTLNNRLSDSIRTEFTSNALHAGILVPVKNLTLGLSGRYVFINDAEIRHTVQGTRVDTLLHDSIFTQKSTYELKPAPSLAFGASYQFTPEWLVAADLKATLWDRFYSEQPLVRPVENAYSFSIGGQYIPAPNLLTPRYHEIIQYRAGFRYTQLPLSTASEFAFTLGAGLPLREGGGLFDIFIEYGRRTDSRYDDYNEEFLGITLGINAGRKWYQSADKSY